MNKIGIVGGAGFIGLALGRHLSKSFLVKILDKKPVPRVFEGKLEYACMHACKPLTPFRHSMYRPMLYVDVRDVCRAFEVYVRKILDGEIGGEGLSNVVNLYWPEPVTILELAGMVRNSVIKYSGGKIRPEVEVVDRGEPILFTPEDKGLIKVDISRVRDFLGLEGLTDPRESIDTLVRERLG